MPYNFTLSIIDYSKKNLPIICAADFFNQCSTFSARSMWYALLHNVAVNSFQLIEINKYAIHAFTKSADIKTIRWLIKWSLIQLPMLNLAKKYLITAIADRRILLLKFWLRLYKHNTKWNYKHNTKWNNYIT